MRVRLAILALALGGFAIGSTEFVAMGLLPNLASDLLPGLYAVSPEEANAQAGWLISAYALGVVVGAPTIATFAARFPRKSVLVWLVAAIAVATVASAVLPSFGLILVARFVAALPHGAYFGIAALVAAELMGPGKRAQGIAIVLSGLTVANIIGVPLITWLGQSTSWRVAYLAVAALFAMTAVAVIIFVPHLPGDPNATMRRELQALRRGQVWLTLLVGAIGFGGFFAVYTYIAPVITEVTGFAPSFVPVALVVIGIGMTAGNLLGGWCADKNLVRSLIFFFLAFALSLLGLALTAESVVGLLVFGFLVGATSSGLAPAIQARFMDVAGDSQTLAAAINHSSLNIGNSMGALLGGLTITAGLGYVSPTWVGLALAIIGGALVIVSIQLGRRTERAPAA